MTFARASAFGACLVGAVIVGIWMSPYVRQHAAWERTSAPTAYETVAPAPVAESSAPPAEVVAARPAPTRVATTKRAPAPRVASGAVIGFSPELDKRLKPLLNQGADFAVAADGFRSAEQFATVAHASRNTDVPFMLLKHRVISEKMTLPEAIRASKPDVDAKAEAELARTEAKADFTAPSPVASNRE